MKIALRSLAHRSGTPVKVLVLSGAAALAIGVGAALATALATSTSPANSAVPTIDGSATVGSTLTANPGTWSGAAPLSFVYQWMLCNASGNACTSIAGAAGQSYTIPSTALGDTLVVAVTATNADGNASAQSAASVAIAAPTALSSSALPTISGTPAVGQTVVAQPGSWTGSQPITYGFQWLLCAANGSGCVPIAGASDSTYLVDAADTGATLSVEVTATNAAGSATDESAQSSAVSASSSAGCPSAATGQAVPVAAVSSPSRLQVAIASVSPPPSTATTTFTATIKVTDTCAQPVSGAEVYATAVPYNQFAVPVQQSTGANGEVTLSFARGRDFPLDRYQELLVLFVRASRPGDPPLAGISTTRLVALRLK